MFLEISFGKKYYEVFWGAISLRKRTEHQCFLGDDDDDDAGGGGENGKGTVVTI